MFLTQNSFNNVNTQDVEQAVVYFGDFSEFFCNEVVQEEIVKTLQLSPTSEKMCDKVFNCCGDEVDNGWSVSTQDSPIVVTRNSDGKQFTVGEMLWKVFTKINMFYH